VEISAELEERVPKWSVLGSVVMIIAGVLAILVPLETSIGIVVILSWMLIFSGVGHLIAAFRFRSLGNSVWELLLAVLDIAIGVYLNLHARLALAPLALVIAGLFLLNGIFELSLYFGVRSTPRSVGILLDAVVSFILGLLIFQHWPSSSIWVMGTFVGIGLLFGGLSRLVLTTGTRPVRWPDT